MVRLMQNKRSNTSSVSRAGISLVEVLISMFVLLFGLMGVASVFPVGSYYIERGDQLDRTSAVSAAALNEISTWGMLVPTRWRDRDGTQIFKPDRYVGRSSSYRRAHAYAIDPLGMAEGIADGVDLKKLHKFPYNANRMPIQRLSFNYNNQLLTRDVTELIFTSRDDLSFNLPEKSDESANALYETDAAVTTTITGTDNALRRAWKGAYSWLIFVGPSYSTGPSGSEIATGEVTFYHDVSVVIFNKRSKTYLPATGSEPMDEREVSVSKISTGYGGGQIQLSVINASQAKNLTNLRTGEWVLLSGNNPNDTSKYFMQWYKIISMENEDENLKATKRTISLKGPDWPWKASDGAYDPGASLGSRGFNMRVGIFKGAVDVVTKTRRLENTTRWSE